MENIVDLLFEAGHLKKTPRSGFNFLGVGHESVAEHTYMTSFIGFVLAQIVPGIDALKLIYMCMLHDLPEARIGDLNYVQKQYVTPDETQALADCTQTLPFGSLIEDLIEEFNAGRSTEAQLAHDADQMSLLLELKKLGDLGFDPPQTWVPTVLKRIQTDIGRQLADRILNSKHDRWWRKSYKEAQ